jgi:hypothetical protein
MSATAALKKPKEPGSVCPWVKVPSPISGQKDVGLQTRYGSDDQVLLAVFVEIPYDDRAGSESSHLNGCDDRCRERAVTGIEIYDDLLLHVVGHSYIRLPVAIEISDGKAGEMLEVGIYILAGFELRG